MPITKSNDKRQQLIDTALQLFYQQGIHAIGINEILAQSGVAKKTLYNHFKSKDALIQACVVERDKRFTEWLKSLCSKANSVEMFIENLFDALDNWINNRVSTLGYFGGCFFVNTAAEYGDSKSDIYQLCLTHKLNVKQFIKQQLSTKINDNEQVGNLVELLIQLKEGVINCAYVMGDKNAALKAKSLALSYLKK
jgi:AcrR family transcriptional regulator